MPKIKKYSMWIEKRNGKYRFSQRYADPLRSRPGKIVYKKVSVTLTKKTAQAKREAASILERKMNEEVANAAKGTFISLLDLTNKYQEHLKATNRPWNTRQRALSNFKYINQYFDGAIAQNITTPMINKFLDYCLYEKERPLSNSSTRLRKVFLSNAYNFGIKYDYVNVNPAKNAKAEWKDETAKKQDEAKNKYLTNEELRAILGYVKFIPNRPDYYYLFKFLSLTGMRLSEAIGLTKKGFFYDGEFWHAKITGNQEYHYGQLYHAEEEGKPHHQKGTRTKTSSSKRDVQLNDAAVKIYNQLKFFRKENEPLFVNRFFNSPWTTFSVDGYLKTICRKLGISKKATSHFFRHTYISKLAEQHQPLNIIMRQVGQKDSNVTKQIYTHVTNLEKDQLSSGLNLFDREIGI